MPRQVENIIGKRFGKLVVVENLSIKKGNNTIHLCQCDCGKMKKATNNSLQSGHTKSCGCLRKETKTKHNLCRTRLYNIFEGMKKRCYNKNFKFYKNYGARGIVICKDWLNDFISFYDWAVKNGYKENLTIDRIDVNGNYDPSNCRWISQKEQSKNTTKNKYFTYNGVTKIISDWAKEFDIPITTLLRRIKQNRPVEEIFYKGDLKCKKTK